MFNDLMLFNVMKTSGSLRNGWLKNIYKTGALQGAATIGKFPMVQ
jgi:hypothetical protein